MIAYIAIGLTLWLGASALILLWMHCATRKPDPEWPDYDLVAEAERIARESWVCQ